MATYDEIKAANGTIELTDIKGKKYAEVSQRIKAFRMVYPNGAIVTEKTCDTGEMCEFTAKVYAEYPDKLIGTGTAYETVAGSNINRTSHIENCETSAVGRALGMCGFGVDTSVASADEMSKVQSQEIIAMYEDALKDYAPKCQRCGNPIFPIFKNKGGETWQISQIIEYSRRRFDGKEYCPGCVNAALKAGE